MGQRPTENKEFYVTEHLSAAFEKEIKLDDPLRPLPTNKISLFYKTSVISNHMRITSLKFSTIFQSATHSKYYSLDVVKTEFLTALTLLR